MSGLRVLKKENRNSSTKFRKIRPRLTREKKANFEKRKQSGVKTFDLKIGDAVLKRRMRKRPIGGKTDESRRGHFVYSTIVKMKVKGFS